MHPGCVQSHRPVCVVSPAKATVATGARRLKVLSSVEAKSGRTATMNRQHTTLFIPHTSDGFEFLVLPKTQKRYSRLIASALARPVRIKQDWETLGKTLVTICRYAHAARQVDVLREACDFLASLPVREELRTIGVYYQAQVLHRTGEIDTARVLFERLATDSRFPWKTRAVADIGACHFDRGDLDTATAFYLEAQRVATLSKCDPICLLKSQWMIGAIRNVQGDHDYAVKSLESLYPSVCYVAKFHRAIYYDYLNSLAVRHVALNHVSEAERLCEMTLSSPFARNFPNWAETRDEIFAAKDAAAATVYVNIEPTPEQKPDVIEQVFKPCELATGPKIGVAINDLVETNEDHSQSTFESASLDSALPNIAVDRSIEPETDPEPQPAINLKIRSAIILSLSKSQRRTSAPAPSTIGLQAPLFLSDAVPGNHRPRAPPTL
jgi:hypothetical protein